MFFKKNNPVILSKKLFLSVSNQLIDCVFFELHLVRFNIDHN